MKVCDEIGVNLGQPSPTSETPFKWRFAGGPIVARFYMRTGDPQSTNVGLSIPIALLGPACSFCLFCRVATWVLFYSITVSWGFHGFPI